MKINSLVRLILISGINTVVQLNKQQHFEEPATIQQPLNISSERLEYIINLLQEYVNKGIIQQSLTLLVKSKKHLFTI